MLIYNQLYIPQRVIMLPYSIPYIYMNKQDYVLFIQISMEYSNSTVLHHHNSETRSVQ